MDFEFQFEHPGLTCEACEGKGTCPQWHVDYPDEHDESSLVVVEHTDLCPDCLGSGVMRCIACGDEGVVRNVADEEQAWCGECFSRKSGISTDPLFEIRHYRVPHSGRFRSGYRRRRHSRTGRTDS